jgi:hypothetical protein
MYFPSGNQAIQINERANKRLLGAVLFSLLVHAFVLTLQLGLPGIGVPSIALPWEEKRAIPVPVPLQIRIAAAVPQAKEEIAVNTTNKVNKVDESTFTKDVSPPPETKSKVEKPQQLQALRQSSKTQTKALTIVSPAPAVAAVSASTKKTQEIESQTIQKNSQAVHILPKLETPIKLITQDQVLNNDFIIPLPPTEEIEEPTRLSLEKKSVIEAIPADSLVNKETQNLPQSLVANINDDLQKKQQEEMTKMETQLALQELEAQQKKAKEEALLVKEVQRQELEKAEKLQQLASQEEALKKLNDLVQQDKISLKPIQQVQLTLLQDQRGLVQNRQAELKRLEDKELAKIQEEQKVAQEEAQALQKVAQLKLQQDQERQLALEQMQQKQKELEAQLEKQRMVELQDKKKNEELLAQQALQKKINEQKLIDENLQKQALVDKKAQEKLLAEKALEATATTAASALNSKNTQNSQSNQTSQNDFGLGNSTNQVPTNLPQTSLANRLRDQARSRDLFKAPLPKMVEEKMNMRKRSFLGAFDKEVPLRMYVDSLKNKLERNGNLIYEKRSVGNEETTLLVNMIIRSDGSIDDVIIIRSSGSYALDEKVKNIIIANAPYAKFPPNVAAKYDVIEVQRIWNFGDKLRIYDELR